MTAYRVSFFKNLVNSRGQPFTTCQGTFKIRAARSRDRAILAAEKRFARLKGIREWHTHADKFEVKALQEPAQHIAG
jgi:hypothetical protein